MKSFKYSKFEYLIVCFFFFALSLERCVKCKVDFE